MGTMLELNDDLIFAEGGRRFCFVHPSDPNRCVKTLSENGDPLKRKKVAVWYKKLRPLSMFDDNLRELKSFQDLEKKGEAVWRYFPRCYGIKKTSRGDGIVTDLIRDADGQISQTVRQYVKARGKTRELMVALDGFFVFLQTQRLVTRDILDHNLVIQVRKEGVVRVVMIDGFGSSEVLPFSRWFKTVGQRKVARKIARCRARYGFVPDSV